MSTLTAREWQILELLWQGYSSKAMAEHLGISPRTVETYRKQIHRKCRTRNTPHLLAYALKRRLIAPTVRDSLEYTCAH